LCSENSGVELNKVRALINGYQDIKLLEDEEKGSLQLFIELAAVLTSAWRFWKFNIDAPDDQKKNTYLQMVAIANEIRAKPNTTFMNAIFFE
jgi:homoserine kinase type II